MSAAPYTTTPQTSYPPAADGVSITPAAAGTFSAWTEVIAAAAGAMTITGASVKPVGGTLGITNFLFVIEIGVGAAGFETAIGQVHGCVNQAAGGAGAPTNPVIYCPSTIPMSGVANGNRVAVRLKIASNPSVSAWRIGLTGIVAAAGVPISTASLSDAYTNRVTITPPGSAWANSSWVQVSASLAADVVVTGLNWDFDNNFNRDAFNPDNETEIDIGVGSVGNEVVVSTLHFWRRGVYPDVGMHYPWKPGVKLTAGSRVCLRMRANNNLAKGCGFTLRWYASPDAGALANSTTQKQVYTPAASAGVLVTSPTQDIPHGIPPWLNGSFIEIDTLTGPLAITSLCMIPTTVGAHYEIDLATGTAGNEVVISTHRIASQGFDPQGVQGGHFPVMPALSLSGAGSIRLSARVRTNASSVSGSAGVYLNVGYISSPSFTYLWPAPHYSLPPSDIVTVTPSGGAWTNSSWQEVVPTTGARDILVVGICRKEERTTSNIEMEVDLGVGAAGAEAVITTFRLGSVFSTNSAGNNRLDLVIPHRVTAGSRLSMRVRRSDTDVNTISFGVEVIDFAPDGTLVVNKSTVPSGSAQTFDFSINGGLLPATFTLGDGQSQSYDPVTPGTYDLEETPVSGWASVATVSNGSPANAITVGSGENVIVNVVNTFGGSPTPPLPATPNRWMLHRCDVKPRTEQTS